MDPFYISVSFSKSIYGKNDDVEMEVSKNDLMSLISQTACKRVGIQYSKKYQFLNMNNMQISMDNSITKNKINVGEKLILINPEVDIYSQQSPTKRDYRRLMWKPLAIISLILPLCGLVIIIAIYAISVTTIYSYSVIIDGGSTSSKIYLYKWASNKFLFNADVMELAKFKTNKGISEFALNPNQSFADIKTILDYNITPIIPEAFHPKTSVYLGATAGMRMLSYNNPNATAQIMNFIRDSLKAYPLQLINPLSDVTIISGDKEAIYGWTTVNYLSGSLPKTIVSNPNLFGALDMGGASAEISFLDNSMNSTETLNLYGNPYRLYSHSYLCYGKSQAEYRFLAVLIQMSHFNTTVENPCLSKMDRMILKAIDIFNIPCVMGKFALEHYGHEIVPPSDWLEKNINVTFNGTGDHNECSKIVGLLFNGTKTCDKSPCTFNGVYQPSISGNFKAFSAFKLIQLDLNTNNENIKLAEYKQRLKTLCNTNSSQSAQFNDDPWAKWKCFDLMYMITILEKFGFQESNWGTLDFIDQISGASIGWALGFMINKTSILQKEKHFLEIDQSLFIILVVVFLIILAFGATFAFLFKTKGKCIRKIHSYSSVSEEVNLISRR